MLLSSGIRSVLLMETRRGTEIVVVFLLLLMIICSARLKSRSVEKQMTYLSRSKFFGGI